MSVRTRFAPSPTGYLHIGGARTALFSWAYARRHQGTFILRVEDTDLERSTPESVQAILDGMQWLDLRHDEGPFYQMQRMDRYREVIAQLLAQGQAYHCYCSKEELELMRKAQEDRGEKARYDRRWRPEPGKALPPIPEGVAPVVRFRNPVNGVVAWDDAVKGRIEISNEELDDLIIARSDGTPTYNFCVVVDDNDMQITQVIRGDDHVNNTPRQINILQALGATIPQYAHVPMILGGDGQRLSKRHGAVSVLQYRDEGYLPEALLNYLARLGWSHGDDEVFSLAQLVDWFDLEHVSASPARFNVDKLNWLNQEYLKALSIEALWQRVQPYLLAPIPESQAMSVLALYQNRVVTLCDLATELQRFVVRPTFEPAWLQEKIPASGLPLLQSVLEAVPQMNAWGSEHVHQMIQTVLAQHQVKMGALGMPLRLALLGTTQTPSLDQTVAALGQVEVVARLEAVLAQYPA